MEKIKFTEKEFKYDQAILKSYAGKRYKLVLIKKLMTSGLDKPKKISVKNSVNDAKLDCNISRARSMIYQYAECNPWLYFVTFTINPKLHDRYNLKSYRILFVTWIKNLNRFRGSSEQLKYLTIPEKHKDGAWHQHGLVNGLQENELTLLTLDMNLPYKIRRLIMQGRVLYKWDKYNNKFGYCVIEKVLNSEAVSKYITKYVKKSVGVSITALGERLYYHSDGLECAIDIKKGTMCGSMVPDYENDYVKLKWYSPNNLNDALSLIL